MLPIFKMYAYLSTCEDTLEWVLMGEGYRMRFRMKGKKKTDRDLACTDDNNVL